MPFFPGNSFHNLIFLISEDAMHQITEYRRPMKASKGLVYDWTGGKIDLQTNP